MDGANVASPKDNLGHHLLVALAISIFFCGFPLLLCDVAYSYLLEIRREALERDQFVRLAGLVDKLQSFSNPEDLVRPILDRLIARASRLPNPTAWLQPRLTRLVSRFPGLFTFTLFNAEGKPIWKSNAGESDYFARKLLAALRLVYNGVSRNINFSSNPSLALFVGSQRRTYKLERILAGWAEISRANRKTWFYCKVGHGLSLFAHVHREGFSPTLGILEYFKHLTTDGIFLNLVDIYTMKVSGHGDQAFQQEAAKILIQSELATINQVKAIGRLFAVGLVNSRYRVLASIPDRISGLPEERSRLFRIFALGVFLLVTLLVIWFRRMVPPPWISLRWKMVVLFGLASFLPLAILLFVISAYTKEREDLLLHQARNTSELLLKNLDGMMIRVNRLCESRLATILGRYDRVRAGSWDKLLGDLKAFQERYRCDSLLLIDKKGIEQIIKSDGHEGRTQVTRLISTLLMSVLSRMRGEEAQSSGKGLGRSGMGIALLLSNEQEELLEDMINSAGFLLRLKLGKVDNFLYYNRVGPPGPAPDHLAAVSWNLPELCSLYFRRYIPFKPLEDGTEVFVVRMEPNMKRFQRKWTDREMRAFQEGSSGWPPPRNTRQGARPEEGAVASKAHGQFKQYYRNLFPIYPKKELGKDFRGFFKSLLTNRTLAHQIVEYKGERFLLSAFPGTSLPDYAFFALRPCRPVVEKIAAMRRTTNLFAFLDAGFTLLLGLFLARKFLDPVREIAIGVKAIQSEAFHHRLPIQDNDEFGDLAVLFNRMIESRRELTMGKQVQDRLFPTSVLEIGNFKVFGNSLPASELGGDYFDYLPYGKDGLLVVHGDATGHGVPAALIMAMAKALVIQFAAQTGPPAALLEALNRAIFSGGSRNPRGGVGPQLGEGGNPLLTLGVLFIDLRSGQGTFYNCGNPFPFRIRPGHPLDCQRWHGHPIGLRQEFRGKPMFFEFIPGERWLFYSDALYESLDSSQESGFDRMVRFLAPRVHLPIEEACRRMLSEHPAVKPGKNLPDDFTILMVERRA